MCMIIWSGRYQWAYATFLIIWSGRYQWAYATSLAHSSSIITMLAQIYICEKERRYIYPGGVCLVQRWSMCSAIIVLYRYKFIYWLVGNQSVPTAGNQSVPTASCNFWTNLSASRFYYSDILLTCREFLLWALLWWLESTPGISR
jgi:hypothetical protein